MTARRPRTRTTKTPANGHAVATTTENRIEIAWPQNGEAAWSQHLHDGGLLPAYRTYNPIRGLTVARVVNLLEGADQGYLADLTWLYRFVERRDGVTSSLFMRRSAAIAMASYSVELEEEVKDMPEMQAAAEEQRDILKRAFGNVDNMREAWTWLGTATFRGYAHLEKHYDTMGRVCHLEPVPQWFWAVPHPRKEWQYNRNASNTNRGEPIDPEDFVIRETETNVDELAALKYVPKSTVLRDWAVLCSRFGVPNIFMTFAKDAGATAGDYAQAKAVLESYVSNGQGALPPGVEPKLFGAAGSSDSTPFPGYVNYIDTELVMRGTGGKLTMLSDPTGIGQGATSAHENVFAEIAQAELAEISDIMQRAIGAPVLNRAFPGQPHLARLVIQREDRVNQKSGAEVLEILKRGGYTTTDEEAEKLVGFKIEKEAAPIPDAGGTLPIAATGELTEKVQDTGLNGAQIASLQQIVQAVADEQLPVEAAIEMLTVAFPLIDQESIRKMIKAAGVFTPSTDSAPTDASNRVANREDPSALEKEGARLQRAIAVDLLDAIKRVQKALLIEDEAKRDAELNAIIAELPKLLAKGNENEAAVDEFERILADAFAEGFAQET